MTTFVLLAGLLLAIALAFALLPLRTAGSARGGRRLQALDDALAAGIIDAQEYAAKRAALGNEADAAVAAPAGRAARRAAVLVAVLLPAAAILLYRQVGEPAALDPARMAAAPAGNADGHGIDMSQAIQGLVAKLEADPGNADGWALLGRAYQSMGRFAESRDALKRARDLLPDNHDITIEYAQAAALAGEGRRIIGEPRALIEGVLRADPDHQRALWLIGISDYQQGDYAAAIGAWNRLLPNLPPDSDIARSVRTQIEDATRLLGEAAAPAAAAPATAAAAPVAAPPATGAQGPRLTVKVSLDPKLAARLDPNATLYVFARAAEGPTMPLAIQRAGARELPLTVTLDDSMGMMPTMKLSMFEKVIVGARLSSSGNAAAQSGDLQALSAPVDSQRREPIDLVIDSVVP